MSAPYPPTFNSNRGAPDGCILTGLVLAGLILFSAGFLIGLVIGLWPWG